VGKDDDSDCAGHVWRVRGAVFDDDGSQVDYECSRCGAVMVESGRGATSPSTSPASPESNGG
jgi:hypothetical protein